MNDFGLLSLLPTIVTIFIALLTKRVPLGLFLGIVTGAIISCQGGITGCITNIWHHLYLTFSDIERLKIAIFLFLVGSLLQIISDSGAYIEFAKKLSTFLNSAKKIRLTTFILGILIFIDDYASVLISGASMRSIIQEKKISFALMAYIVDTVATMVSIVLISTWSAFEGSVMVSAIETVGIKKSSTELLLSSPPYHFCTYSGIFLAFLVALTGKWFGTKLDNQKMEENQEEIIGKGGKFIHVFLPICILIFCSIGGLLYSGLNKYLTAGRNEINIIYLLGDAPTINILIFSTIIALITSISLLSKDHVMNTGSIISSFYKGAKKMVLPSLVIIFSKGLSEISSVLGTGLFITKIFSNVITPLTLPAITVISAGLLTIATGISWSSMAIIMPIVYQICIKMGQESLIPVISGAVISGSIFGGLLIPYSDTSVMVSAAFKMSPIYHVKTQFPQILTVFIVSILGYILIGYGLPLLVIYVIGIFILMLVHYIFGKERKNIV